MSFEFSGRFKIAIDERADEGQVPTNAFAVGLLIH
jgi:hypothetical protein